MVQALLTTAERDPVPNRYNRMTGAQLSAALKDPAVDLTVGKFARLVGSQKKRVLAWIDGRDDIPHHVPVVLSLLTLPGAKDLALAVTNTLIVEQDDDD